MHSSGERAEITSEEVEAARLQAEEALRVVRELIERLKDEPAPECR